MTFLHLCITFFWFLSNFYWIVRCISLSLYFVEKFVLLKKNLLIISILNWMNFGNSNSNFEDVNLLVVHWMFQINFDWNRVSCYRRTTFLKHSNYLTCKIKMHVFTRKTVYAKCGILSSRWCKSDLKKWRHITDEFVMSIDYLIKILASFVPAIQTSNFHHLDLWN